ncbi:MAG: hypothetical protein LBO05_11140 [Deltaproteobacteria bacterium]|jgi:hypothetical protein|nr:hypothetical protein [Deltaproteobacteria bacterium]
MSPLFPPILQLGLWRLLSVGGSAWKTSFKPESLNRKPGWTPAVRAGLVEIYKERPGSPEPASSSAPASSSGAAGRKGKKTPSKPRPPQERLKIRLTEAGRRYLTENCGARVSETSKVTGETFNWLLGLIANDPALAAALAARLNPTARGAGHQGSAPVADGQTLIRHINSLPPSSFMAGGGLRICVLKGSLPGCPPGDVDRALMDLLRAGKVTLYHFDDPRMIAPEDEAGAMFIAGKARHYLHLI